MPAARDIIGVDPPGGTPGSCIPIAGGAGVAALIVGVLMPLARETR